MIRPQITRRSLELFSERYPHPPFTAGTWRLPRVDGGGIKVPLAKIREAAATTDEAARSLPH